MTTGNALPRNICNE